MSGPDPDGSCHLGSVGIESRRDHVSQDLILMGQALHVTSGPSLDRPAHVRRGPVPTPVTAPLDRAPSGPGPDADHARQDHLSMCRCLMGSSRPPPDGTLPVETYPRWAPVSIGCSSGPSPD
eukprot:9469095-Pyramimonas_sp.AAC.2